MSLRERRGFHKACRKVPFEKISPDMEMEGHAKAIVSLAVAGRWTKSEDYLDELSCQCKSIVSTKFYHLMLRLCSEKRQPAVAAWLLQHMHRQKLVPNIVTYNSLMNCCAQAGKLDLAEGWWRELESSGQEPNAVSFNVMINACAQVRDPKRAGFWIARMFERGLQPSAVTFGSAIDACAKKGRLKEAEAWARRMRECGLELDQMAYNSLLNACAKAGDLQAAERWFKEMVASGVQPNERAFSSLIHACSADMEKAEQWFQYMVKAGCQLDLVGYSSMINVAAKAGNIARAEAWMEELMHAGLTPNTICYNTLLHACVRSTDYTKAVKWMGRMLCAGVTPNMITYNCMIGASASGGNKATTQFWLQQLIRAGLHPDDATLATLGRSHSSTITSKWALTTILAAYLDVGDATSVRPWFAAARAAGCSLPAAEKARVANLLGAAPGGGEAGTCASLREKPAPPRAAPGCSEVAARTTAKQSDQADNPPMFQHQLAVRVPPGLDATEARREQRALPPRHPRSPAAAAGSKGTVLAPPPGIFKASGTVPGAGAFGAADAPRGAAWSGPMRPYDTIIEGDFVVVAL